MNAATTVRKLLAACKTSLLCRRLSQQILGVSEKELELLLKSDLINNEVFRGGQSFFRCLVQSPIPVPC